MTLEKQIKVLRARLAEANADSILAKALVERRAAVPEAERLTPHQEKRVLEQAVLALVRHRASQQRRAEKAAPSSGEGSTIRSQRSDVTMPAADFRKLPPRDQRIFLLFGHTTRTMSRSEFRSLTPRERSHFCLEGGQIL
jgi:hypothetical protein